MVFSNIPPIFASYYSSLKKQKMDIPSAEEYYSKTMFPALSKYKPDEIKLWFETNTDAQQSVNIMIEFAKLHVQAALESAYKNSIMYKDLGEGEDGKICYEMGDIFYDEYDYPIAISKNSILDAYSLENIK